MKINYKTVLFTVLAILFIAAVSFLLLNNNDNKIAIEEDSDEWNCSHDPETFTEPTLQNGKYYENGDTSSAYCFIINGTEFTVSGDIDKLIDDYNIPYSDKQDDLLNSDIPQRADEHEPNEKQYPSYNELKQKLSESMKSEIFTVHELDDDCFIFVRNNEEKMLSFEYISDHEFEAGDKKFILAN